MKLATRIFKRTDWYITCPYGKRINPITHKEEFHYGCDYGTHTQKWPQYALEDGIITSVGKSASAGNYLHVNYPRINKDLFHCHLDIIYLKKGDKVNSDTVLGLTGKTGQATGIHLHLGLRPIGGSYENPENYDYIPPSEIVNPVERNENMNQIEVIKDKLRVRKSPSLKGEILGFAKIGFYNYSETSDADGYTWYKIGNENWIADVKGYTNIYPYSDYVSEVKKLLSDAEVKIIDALELLDKIK